MPRILITALICGLLCGPAAATEWRVVDADSHIAFHGSMLGVPVTGYFQRFKSQIKFDRGDLENAHLSIVIDMTSVNTAHDERDTALKLPEWFAVEAYTQADFAAEEFRRTGDDADDTYEAIGSLTVKGLSKNITLPFSLVIDGDTAFVSGRIDLNRRDFNIGEGDWANDRLVAFDVQVEFQIVARRISRQ